MEEKEFFTREQAVMLISQLIQQGAIAFPISREQLSSAMDSTASRGRMTLKSLRSLLPKRTQSSHPSPSTSRSFHDRSDILQTLAKLESVHSSSQEIITFADSSGIKRTPPEVWPSSY